MRSHLTEKKWLDLHEKRWKSGNKHIPFNQLNWLLSDFYISVRKALADPHSKVWADHHYSSKCSSSGNVMDSEHNMSTENEIFGHNSHYTKLWMERSISNLPSETVRWLSGVTLTVTLTAGSQNRIFSLIYSDPNKKNVLSQRYSSFPCVDLDPYVWARIYFEEFYCSLFTTAESDVYKQMSSETPPRKCNLQTCSVNPGQESSNDSKTI